MQNKAISINKPTKKGAGKRKLKISLVLYLLPFMILVGIFAYAPIFGWYYAFIDYLPGKSVFDCNFVGLKYFNMIFSGASDFWVVLRNTLCLSGLGLLCSVIPVIFAIMISQVRYSKFSRTVQTLTSIPNFISWVLVYSIIFSLLASEDSALNVLMLNMGISETPVNVLTNVNQAWTTQTLIGIWKNTGYNAILYLAAISSIDQELYQAADVDGANKMQKIWHVTIPGIMSTFFVLLLLSISNMLSNGFDQYWMFGNGMTWDKLEVFDTYVYRVGIQNMEYSLSTALGIFKSLVSIILLTSANQLSKKLRGESIF